MMLRAGRPPGFYFSGNSICNVRIINPLNDVTGRLRAASPAAALGGPGVAAPAHAREERRRKPARGSPLPGEALTPLCGPQAGLGLLRRARKVEPPCPVPGSTFGRIVRI